MMILFPFFLPDFAAMRNIDKNKNETIEITYTDLAWTITSRKWILTINETNIAREGLEPSTSALWELRSNRLSYLAKTVWWILIEYWLVLTT
jgi:hypothetical protein